MSNFCRPLFAFALVFACAISFSRTQQNSFLNRTANTLPDLLSQVKQDDEVASRFMRHFGKSKEDVLQMFGSLKLGRLQQDGVYLIYNVPGWEEVRSKAMFYRKGTLVWTDQNGTPVLKVSCGNPMVRGTDLGFTTVAPGMKAESTEVYRELVATNIPETSFVDYSPLVTAPGVVDMTAADILPVTPSVPSVSRVMGAGLILPVVAGLFLGLNGGDSPPVPEPCTMAIMGVGGAALVARRKFKASKASSKVN